jgi:uncharacterized protein (TIGR03067 family)
MNRYVLAALSVGLLVGADDPSKDKGKKGATALEGTWVVVSATEGGREDKDLKNVEIVFKGNNIVLKTKDGDITATFRIDPKKKTFDLTPADGPGKGKTFKGIFQLKGDELKVCHAPPGKDRPKDFTSEKGSRNVLVVLKRAKDKGDNNAKGLASVEGTVRFDGQPLPKATVVFVPVNKGGQKATGTTNAKGEYKLTTKGKKGALPGDYKVVITKMVGGKSVLPDKYGSEKTTPLKVSVVANGRNTFEIELTSRR